ncbi:MAG: glycosyltransferase family 4 protein [Gloeomargarita sp. DG02_4_bins_56]
MRILIVTGIFPPDVGGPATYVPVVAQGLQELGHRVTVVTSSEPAHLTVADGGYPFPVVRLNRRLPWAFRSVYYQQKLAEYMGSCDVVYGNGLVWEVAQVCQKWHQPWVAKIVGDSTWERAVRRGWTNLSLDEFQAPQADMRIQLFRCWRNQALRQAEHVIVPSSYLAAMVQKWGIPPERVTVIYNAVDLPRNIPEIQNPLTTPYRVITAGRLVPWKQMDEIITAIAPLPDVGLLIVGEGSQRQKLEQQVNDLGLNQRVYFTGQKNQLELLALMKTCDLFVLNSTYEGLPHIVLEAMSVGIPVIATAVGGTPELVQNQITGRLIPPHSPPTLQQVIGELRRHPERGQYYVENARRLLRNFQTQNMIDRCAEILESVGGSKGVN